MVEIIINGRKVEVEENTTILEACKKLNINIPTLCYHPDLSIKANCRICIVEIEGSKELKTACNTIVTKGMKILTDSDRVKETRKVLLDLLISSHNFNCVNCSKNLDCELQNLCKTIGISNRYTEYNKNLEIDDSNHSIVRDPNRCIKCGRCIDVCKNTQGLSILGELNRSDDLEIIPYNGKLADSYCTFCGQCVLVCPVGALVVKSDIDKLTKALNDKDKYVIVQVAPSIRVAIGEMFNMDPGTITTGKLITALKLLGFKQVFDTNFAADLTIMEESHELIERIANNGKLPMITSCSPGWINYIEQYYPELLDHLSTCKSPQQMFGAIAKNYYYKKINIPKEKLVVVSIMPCTAKKFESKRKEMNNDVDIVITTKELATLLRQKDINLNELEETDFNLPFGISTGAGAIFGSTGGVMEAALRTTYELMTKKELKELDFKNVRGLKGIKEATININKKDIKVAVAYGLKNAKKILENIKNNTCDYTFIEIMACPGGCISGGGMPYTTNEIREKRINALYKIDKKSKCRKAHDNEAVQILYEDFLDFPGSKKAHELLHTTYKNRKKN